MIQAGTGTLMAPRRRRGIQVTSAGTSGSAWAATVLGLSPTLFWRLGEPSGPTAADASGNGRTGTYSGATLGQTGLITNDSNTCISLPGNDTTSGVTSTFNPFVIGASQTFIGWCNRTTTATADGMFSGTGSSFPFLFAVSGSTDVTWQPGGSTNVTWTAAMPTATRTFWAMTYNDTTRVSELFINAVSQGTKTSPTAGYVTPGNANLGLGNAVGSGWGGTMDEFAIFASALSGANITALYNAGV